MKQEIKIVQDSQQEMRQQMVQVALIPYGLREKVLRRAEELGITIYRYPEQPYREVNPDKPRNHFITQEELEGEIDRCGENFLRRMGYHRMTIVDEKGIKIENQLSMPKVPILCLTVEDLEYILNQEETSPGLHEKNKIALDHDVVWSRLWYRDIKEDLLSSTTA